MTAAPRIHILFVDDEPMFLNSLRTVLRKQRDVWEMSFAVGPHEALDFMAQTPVDVVVSDLRMPEMDGAEFLRRVQELDPGAARLVLSGQADSEMLARAAPVAQQYLAKPCSSDKLRRVLGRVCELQQALGNRAVRDLVGRAGRLPAVPETYGLLSRTLARPGVTTRDVAPIVAGDPAMSAKLLQLANSPHFRTGEPVTSVAQAVAILGLDLVLHLPMMISVFAADEGGSGPGCSLPDLLRGSIATARLAARLAADPVEAELAFTAGLIHEIGRILLVREAQVEMAEVVQRSASSGRSMSQVERELLGTTHAEIGAYLLGMWGLPLQVVEAVAYHHAIPAARRSELRLAALVHAADVLLEQAIASRSGAATEELDTAALDAHGFTAQLPAWREQAAAEAQAAATE